MKKNLCTFNHAFASGALGAAAGVLLVWWMGAGRILRRMDISYRPDLTLAWISPRIFLGGLLGLLLLLPLSKITGWKKGLLLSLVPTTLDFFISFPSAGAGNMGLKLGMWMPFVILFSNALGCILAVFWAEKTGGI